MNGYVSQSFKIKQTVTDGVLSGVARPVENGDVHLDVKRSSGSSDMSASSSRTNGPTTADKNRSVNHVTADSATKLSARNRTAAGSVTVDSRNRELDVRQQPIHCEQALSSSPSLLSNQFISTTTTTTTTTAATTTAAAAAAVATTSSNSSFFVPSSFSQKVGHVMPTYMQTPATSESSFSSSSSHLFTSDTVRLSMAEVRPSTANPGPGSAVARLFGTSSTQPGVLGPAVGVGGTSSGSRGRRSMHHSWVGSPGRAAFTDTEAAHRTLSSAVASRAATVVTVASSDDSRAPNHF